MIDVPYVKQEFGHDLTRAHEHDAGFDLCAASFHTLHPGHHQLIPTDVQVAIPEGHVGMVCSRSGLAAKNGVFVLNAPGVVDSGYRGTVGVILANFGTEIYSITSGDRIAQLVIMPVSNVRVFAALSLEDTDRGANGFGSSGGFRQVH